MAARRQGRRHQGEIARLVGLGAGEGLAVAQNLDLAPGRLRPATTLAPSGSTRMTSKDGPSSAADWAGALVAGASAGRAESA